MKKFKCLFSCFVVFTALICYIGCKPGLLIAPNNSTLVVSVNPTHIPVGGTATVQVIGYKASGTPFPDGTIIFFSCDFGAIDAQAETVNGIAYATFRSNDNLPGTANIFVSSGNAQMSPESVTVTIGNTTPDSLSLTANPQVLPVGGGTAYIYIIAYGEALNSLPNIPITLTTDAGQLTSRGTVIYTNAEGRAEDILQTTTTANVTAASGTISAQITIIVESDESPTASFIYSPLNPEVGQKVYFNASSSSDPDGYIVSYKWDLGDGSTASGQKITHKYMYPGTYAVLLVVEDDSGNEGSTSNNISIGDNEMPTASFVYSPTNPTVNQSVYFNASSSTDPDGYIVGYEWDFGDGSKATGQGVNHQFSTSGTFTVTLVVTDNSGNTASTNKTISISSSQNAAGLNGIAFCKNIAKENAGK